MIRNSVIAGVTMWVLLNMMGAMICVKTFGFNAVAAHQLYRAILTIEYQAISVIPALLVTVIARITMWADQ